MIRYYETTAFYGRESDGDVVITPGMALILPGQPWQPPEDYSRRSVASLDLGVPSTVPPDDGMLDTELGPSGVKKAAAPAAAGTIGLPTPLGAGDHDEND
jgi:hypothetical protein